MNYFIQRDLARNGVLSQLYPVLTSYLWVLVSRTLVCIRHRLLETRRLHFQCDKTQNIFIPSPVCVRTLITNTIIIDLTRSTTVIKHGQCFESYFTVSNICAEHKIIYLTGKRQSFQIIIIIINVISSELRALNGVRIPGTSRRRSSLHSKKYRGTNLALTPGSCSYLC